MKFAREGHTRKKERKALNNAKLQSCNYLVELEPYKKQSCLSDKLSVKNLFWCRHMM